MLKQLPISHRVFKRAHEILLSGLSAGRGARKRPGEYKHDQNWIGGYKIEQARYVPPPPLETQRCMDELEAFINREDIPPVQSLIDLALVHYQFEAIHPFADGNGRVGRMMISVMAVHNGLLDVPILYMSPALEKSKDQYIDLMFDVSTKGKWEDWLRFFFEKMEEACHDTVSKIDGLIDLQTRYRILAGKTSRSSKIISVVDHLFETPVITVGETMKLLGVTYPAARSIIEKLVEIDVLIEFSGRYPKVFFAPEILRISRPQSSAEGEAESAAS